jgi:hypothetical protein
MGGSVVDKRRVNFNAYLHQEDITLNYQKLLTVVKVMHNLFKDV